MSQKNDDIDNDNATKTTDEVAKSAVVELSSEQKLLLFQEFREQQKLLLEQQNKENEDKTKDAETPGHSGRGKKRKHAEEDVISLLGVGSTASTDFHMDMDGEKTKDPRSQVQPWLNSLLGDEQEDPYTPDEEDSTGDPLDGLFPTDMDTSGGGVAVPDKEMEGILRSRYTAIMEHTKEKMGDPVVPNIEKMIDASWGKLKLAAKTKTDIHEKIPIPSNCAQLKPPRLNTEVYIRVYENAAIKDKTFQDRQRDIATIRQFRS